MVEYFTQFSGVLLHLNILSIVNTCCYPLYDSARGILTASILYRTCLILRGYGNFGESCSTISSPTAKLPQEVKHDHLWPLCQQITNTWTEIDCSPCKHLTWTFLQVLSSLYCAKLSVPLMSTTHKLYLNFPKLQTFRWHILRSLRPLNIFYDARINRCRIKITYVKLKLIF